MTLFKKLCLCLILIPALSSFCLALEPPSSPSAYVNDYAGILTPAQRGILNSDLREFENKTSIQIFIAVFKSLEGENLEDFSIRLAEKWQPGVEGKDNGVLITVFMTEQRVRIEAGYGLEGTLTDALSSVIIQKELAPEFRKGDYYAGIRNTVQKIVRITGGEFTAEQIEEYSRGASIFDDMVSLVFTVIVAIALIAFIIRHPFLAFLLLRGVVLGGRGGGGGGFGGGRGGGFGGGGASGGW